MTVYFAYLLGILATLFKTRMVLSKVECTYKTQSNFGRDYFNEVGAEKQILVTYLLKFKSNKIWRGRQRSTCLWCGPEITPKYVNPTCVFEKIIFADQLKVCYMSKCVRTINEQELVMTNDKFLRGFFFIFHPSPLPRSTPKKK